MNFINQTWIKLDETEKVISPYKQLPPLFDNVEDIDKLDLLITDNNLADGGAAMTAYARMQFTEMTEFESKELQNALLKYCELDTLAMVMIWEFMEYDI